MDKRQKIAAAKNEELRKKASGMSKSRIDNQVRANSSIEKSYGDLADFSEKSNPYMKKTTKRLRKKESRAKAKKDEGMSMRSAQRHTVRQKAKQHKTDF
jgi:hypothetical protein